MEKKIVGWYIPDEHRPDKISDLEWADERLITVEAVELGDGFLPEWEERVVPVYIEVE